MDASDLDRLEQSVKRAFEKIERLESQRNQLSAEKEELINRLNGVQAETNRLPKEVQPVLSVDRVGEIKARLAKLLERIDEVERQL